MKREVISSVIAAVCMLFVGIIMVTRSGSTQTEISDCKEPFGNPPCNVNNNATFNDGKNTGCKVDFRFPYATPKLSITYKKNPIFAGVQ